MKKFYAIMASVLMSTCLFAANPTANDLATFVKDGHYVVCFSTPAEATCNTIVWIGTYDEWNADDPDKVVCQPLNGFEGWYVAVVPVVDGENSGKPVQLSECNKFTWDYQCGAYGTIELVSGSVDIVSSQNGAETDLKNWSLTEPTIITMSAWKNSPCSKECSEHKYTIRVADPFCESNPEFEPTIMGSFNNWKSAATMTFDEESQYFVYTTDYTSNLQFKFNNDKNGGWNNQFEYWAEPEEEGEEGSWKQFDNFVIDDEEAALTNFVLTYDFSDNTKYRYASCGLDDNAYDVTVTVTVPAGAPEAGVEIVGSFNGWPNELDENALMTKGENNVYTVTVNAKGTDEFKFREAGTWANEIIDLTDLDENLNPKGIANMKFADKWDENHAIVLDFSDAEKYAWKVAASLENIVLTEAAHKIMVDGHVYIIRDNKLFNVIGTQVR